VNGFNARFFLACEQARLWVHVRWRWRARAIRREGVCWRGATFSYRGSISYAAPACAPTWACSQAKIYLSAADVNLLHVMCNSRWLRCMCSYSFDTRVFPPMQVAFTDALKHKSSERKQFNWLNNFENLTSKNNCSVKPHSRNICSSSKRKCRRWFIAMLSKRQISIFDNGSQFDSICKIFQQQGQRSSFYPLDGVHKAFNL